MKEVWKPVIKLVRFDPSYNVVDVIEIRNGYYVSSMGRLKYKGKIRKNRPEPKGYIQDFLFCKNGKRERFKRHQIVMQTFCPYGISNGYSVDHIDRNTENNSLENLRWAERKTQVQNRDNISYKYRKVVCENDLMIFSSCQEAEKFYGLAKNTVSRVARGDEKTIHDLSFKYI